jgi:hypothetical protein
MKRGRNCFYDEMDKLFSSFLNTYLRVFNNSFPAKNKLSYNYNKAWLTVGIRTSCQHKSSTYYVGIQIILYFISTTKKIL